MDWDSLFGTLVQEGVKGGAGALVANMQGSNSVEAQKIANEGAIERQRLSDQAEMERLLESLGVTREQIDAAKKQAVLSSTTQLTGQALSNIPDAYKTLIQGLLAGRQQEQGGFAALSASGQRAAMGK